MRSFLLLLLLTSSALAADFPVNDQDQANIQGICDTAAASPSLNRDMRAGIASWCVAWEKRVAEAAKPQDKPPARPQEPASNKK